MYRTTSVMALGLFLGLAPIGALAQTDDTQQQQLQTDTDTQQQQMQTETLQSDDQQATETETLQTDDQQATETETLQTDDQQTTETETLQTDDQQATETETLDTGDDADMATDDGMATDEEADVATGDMEEDVIPEQDQSEMLASSMIGASVNLADESIGTVSDLIITEDNTVRGVVVGVGGFLGIGEKRVALPLSRITVQSSEPGTVELSTDMSREELEQKEAFRTAAQIRQEEEAAQAQQQQQMDQPLQ